MRFVGVGGQDDMDELASFVNEYGVGEFQQLGDTNARVWRFFKVTSQPTYVFINDNGALSMSSGALDADELSVRLQELIDT